MKTFLGTKTIRALPMLLSAYQALRNYPAGVTAEADQEGYLVEYTDGGMPNHPEFDGYISWSPKEQFEAAYRVIEGDSQALTFGDALIALKAGRKVARAGWNGKGMFVSMSGQLGGSYLFHDLFWSRHNREFAAEQPNGTALVMPCLTLKAADGSIVMGWLASQTDMLAEDWQVLS